ncbi:MAG: hypothetical protein M3441_06360 [Chloroflexota bacterium]|nr:hypothetical protein [Chloroflexota bacterium]
MANQPPQQNTTTTDGNPKDQYALERYKYILKEIQALNGNLYRYLTLFQVLASAIIGSGITLFVGWQELNIDASAARAGIYGLLGLLVLIAAFIVLSLIIGVLSWLDYRREEVELLDREVGKGLREKPRLRNFWRWHETHVILFVIFTVAAIYLYTENYIIPLIK